MSQNIVVYRDAKFTKCIERLRRAGGKGTLATARIEEIIESIVDDSGSLRAGSTWFPRMTKNGERRISTCRKYDLGNGYRLICAREEECLVLLYAGTHDDCDRWLENNRGLRPVVSRDKVDYLPVSPPEHRSTASEHVPGPETNYELVVMEKITERDLRSIFSGICGTRI